MKLSSSQWVDVLCALMEAEGQPADTIAAMRAVGSSARGTADLKDMIHHGLFAARFYPPEVRTRLEALLRSKDLPPLAKLDTGYWDACLRILKRGRIRNDEEFYIVAEILGGPDYDELSSAQQKELGEISYAYEKKRSKG